MNVNKPIKAIIAGALAGILAVIEAFYRIILTRFYLDNTICKFVFFFLTAASALGAFFSFQSFIKEWKHGKAGRILSISYSLLILIIVGFISIDILCG